MLGFSVEFIYEHPLTNILLPLLVLYVRNIKIENLPDHYEKCSLICKTAEQYYNKQPAIEMGNFNSFIQNGTELQLPLNKEPLLCVEDKLSLLQRYKLRKLTESLKAENKIQYFNEFIQKFSESDPDPEAVYEEILKSKQKKKLFN